MGIRQDASKQHGAKLVTAFLCNVRETKELPWKLVVPAISEEKGKFVYAATENDPYVKKSDRTNNK